MKVRTVRQAAVAVLGVASLAGAMIAGANPASAAPTRQAVPNSAPAWLPQAQKTGTASPAAAVSARIYLTPNGGLDALKTAAIAASTPGSSAYRKFLSTAAYNAKYQPTSATVSTVTKWLASNGLAVTEVGEGNRYLTISGNVAAAQKAFAVTVATFTHDGEHVQAPESALTVPKDVSSAVLAVAGLDTSSRAMTHHDVVAPPPIAFVNSKPCSQYYGQLAGKYADDYHTLLPKFNGQTLPYTVCGYTGPQLRAAYEGDTTLTGAGVSVAIIDAYASPTMPNDVKAYSAAHGDGSYAPGQLLQLKPFHIAHSDDCDASGWYGEETLDIEAVHAMAPAANIRYYGAKTCFDSDLIDTMQKVVNQNTVQIISNSYGDTETNATVDSVLAWEQVFLQGALEGISILFSSGDGGDELQNTGLKTADFPTSDPFVTSVGGTSTAIDQNGKLAWQSGWGTVKYNLAASGTSWTPVGFTSGGGGGYSSLFSRPSYQYGVVPTSAPSGRAVPDVAMDGDPNTGMLVGQTQTYPDGSVHYGEYRIGGTSLSSPLFAGMTALTLQAAGGGPGLGLLNPTVYALAKSGVFTDVKGGPKDIGNVRADFKDPSDTTSPVVYSVRLFGMDSSLYVTPGWDTVTGVGTPNKGWLTAIAPL